MLDIPVVLSNVYCPLPAETQPINCGNITIELLPELNPICLRFSLFKVMLSLYNRRAYVSCLSSSLAMTI